MRNTNIPATRLMVSLPLLIVVTAIFIAISAGTVATGSFYAHARRAIEANLTVLAHDKRNAVETLLHQVKQDLVNAAGNPLVQHGLDTLAISIKIMPPEARAVFAETYATANEQARDGRVPRALRDYYGRAYDNVNPWFRALAKDAGYPDILFVDRDGNVAYSLVTRADFGARVTDAALQGSSLADLFDRAAKLPAGSTLATDFRPYAPANGTVAMAGAPVYETVGDRQDFIGVLVVELPRARIDAILNDPEGFGGTGEAALVGEDGLLRSDSRFGSNCDILRKRFATGPLGAADRHAGMVSIRSVRGLDMIAALAPLAIDDLRWSVVAAESVAEVFGPVQRMIEHIVLICLAATAILAGLAVSIAQRMARPVVALVERFDAALSNMQHGLVMIDAENRLILCNRGFAEMYALPSPLTAPGTPLALIDDFRRMHGDTVIGDAQDGHATGRYDLPDGRTIDIVRSGLASGGFVATHQNITTTVHAQKQITYLATHDALTGLLNRSSLTARMDEALGRVSNGGKLAVLCLDLDYFKAVNDMLGHPSGDALLKAVASRLAERLTGHAVLARLGGDEFVILQEDIQSTEEALHLAASLIEAIAVPFDIDGHHVMIGLSVGIAVTPSDGTVADQLLKNADLALYRAKDAGRGSCRFFEPGMDAQLQARRQLECDLRLALAGDQFELAYQPVYDVMTEAVTGVEALLRWRHPERGIVSPADFIPVAEEMGLIVPIGDWVIRRACADAVAWPGGVRVAVNLSPIQLKSPGLVATVISALAESGLPPMRLELEITETVLLSESEATLAALHKLKSLGLRIAMDDFGTGYSSLSYLRSFPFDKIKIDQCFVRELGEHTDSVAIIRAIADLGTSLGMATTVEGVETVEQLHLVRKQGCTEVQGFFMCRPIAADKISRMFEALAELPRLTA